MEIQAVRPNEGDSSYYVLITDCGSDGRVVSDINDNLGTLEGQGYAQVLGLRDLRPLPRDHLGRLSAGIEASLRASELPCYVNISVMETEAWFLGEYSHLERVHNTLDAERVLAELDIDLAQEDLEQRDWPANDLDAIYGLAGLSYQKSEYDIRRTLDALDWSMIAGPLMQKFSSLESFVGSIAGFFEQ